MPGYNDVIDQLKRAVRAAHKRIDEANAEIGAANNRANAAMKVAKDAMATAEKVGEEAKNGTAEAKKIAKDAMTMAKKVGKEAKEAAEQSAKDIAAAMEIADEAKKIVDSATKEIAAVKKTAEKAQKTADEAKKEIIVVKKTADEAKKEIIVVEKTAEEAKKEIIVVKKTAEEAKKEIAIVEKTAEEAMETAEEAMETAEEAMDEIAIVKKEAEEAKQEADKRFAAMEATIAHLTELLTEKNGANVPQPRLELADRMRFFTKEFVFTPAVHRDICIMNVFYAVCVENTEAKSGHNKLIQIGHTTTGDLRERLIELGAENESVQVVRCWQIVETKTDTMTIADIATDVRKQFTPVHGQDYFDVEPAEMEKFVMNHMARSTHYFSRAALPMRVTTKINDQYTRLSDILKARAQN